MIRDKVILFFKSFIAHTDTFLTMAVLKNLLYIIFNNYSNKTSFENVIFEQTITVTMRFI